MGQVSQNEDIIDRLIDSQNLKGEAQAWLPSSPEDIRLLVDALRSLRTEVRDLKVELENAQAKIRRLQRTSGEHLKEVQRLQEALRVRRL